MTPLAQTNNSTLSKDDLNKTILSSWIGDVSLEEFIEGFDNLNEDYLNLENSRVILDFKNVEDITAEARIWFEDEFLTSNAGQKLFDTEKLAIVYPSKLKAEIMISNLLEVVESHYNELDIKTFTNLNKATKWTSVNSKSNIQSRSVEDKVFGFFGLKLAN